MKGYLRGTAWHGVFYTSAGRQRTKHATKNKRQAERRAREVAELILARRLGPKPQAGTFALFARDKHERSVDRVSSMIQRRGSRRQPLRSGPATAMFSNP